MIPIIQIINTPQILSTKEKVNQPCKFHHQCYHHHHHNQFQCQYEMTCQKSPVFVWLKLRHQVTERDCYQTDDCCCCHCHSSSTGQTSCVGWEQGSASQPVTETLRWTTNNRQYILVTTAMIHTAIHQHKWLVCSIKPLITG